MFDLKPSDAQLRFEDATPRSPNLGVVPDLVAIGKAVGGGFPLGAFGGRADLMDNVLG